MRIPDDKLEEVKAATDIVEVVADAVRLKKQGARFIGLCPFHNEKTPSFSVDPVNNLYYCFGCLDEDEPIWTHRGLIPIGTVNVEDRVLGIDGGEERVVDVWKKAAPVREIHLGAVRRDPLRLTGDHVCVVVSEEAAVRAVPMLYRQANRGVRFQSRKRSYDPPRTARAEPRLAEEVRPGDYVLFPVISESDRCDADLAAPVRRVSAPMAVTADGARAWPRPKGPSPRVLASLPVSVQTARLFGLWLAEGSVYRGGVRWSFHADEEDYARFVVDTLRCEFGLAASVHRRPAQTLLEVTCSSTHLSRLLPHYFGKGAAGKRVPWEALWWSVDVQRALVEGYLDGARPGGGQAVAYSVSEALARGLFAVAVQAGYVISMGKEERPTSAGRPIWRLAVRSRESADAFYSTATGRRAYWLRVAENVATGEVRTVVDIETTGSHTFTTKLGAVHNCQRGGDAIKFVRETEGLEFTEAVRLLAERAGIELPEEGAADPAHSENEAVLHALRFAARFYYDQLTQTDEGRERGLGYLQGRGLEPATIKRFGLGYAPGRWDALVVAAEQQQIKPEVLEKAGLVLPNKKGDGYHDRFRERAMFPILSRVGKVLGFGGRILPGADQGSGDYTPPKYINSPETRVYRKSRVLYGLYQGRQAIRGQEEAVMVEGYTDVIALHQAGVENVVASSGTALTPEQVQALGRYAKTVLLLYDADAAGATAALRGIDLVLAAGLAAYAVALPDGADPDSFVRMHGGEAFRNYLRNERQTFVDFRVAAARRVGELDTPEGQARTAEALLQSVALIPNTVAQDGYLRLAGQALGVPDIQLRVRFRELLRDGTRRAAPTPPAVGASAVRGRGEGERGGPAPPEPVVMKPEEEALIRLMLEHGSPMVEHVLGHMALEEFSAGPVREAAGHLLVQYEAGNVDADAFTGGAFGQAVQRVTAGALADRHTTSENWKRRGITAKDPELNEAPYEAAASAMTLLKLDRVAEAIEEQKRRLYAVEQAGEDPTPILQAMQQLHALRSHVERRGFLEAAP